MSPREVLSAKLRRIDEMAREGASMGEIARGLNVPEATLLERHIVVKI